MGDYTNYAKHGANPDSKVYEAAMVPIWGRQDPSGPLVGPMNFYYLGSHTISATLIIFPS